MEFPLTITESFLQRSHAARIFRGKWFLLLAVALIGTGLAVGEPGVPLDTMDLVGIICLLFCAVFFSIVWFKQLASIREWGRQQGTDPIIYHLSEDFIEVSSNLGSSKLKWSVFHRLIITDFDTLLKFSRHGALTMPTVQVPAEAMEMIISQFREHSLAIEDRRKTQSKP